jgi:hypothetical protein
MVEPISLGVIGGVALTEGVKFLYSQVGDWLKRRRDLKNADSLKNENQTLPVTTTLPPALGGDRISSDVPFEYIDAKQSELVELRSALSNYADETLADETLEVDRTNVELLGIIDDLRKLAEEALGRRLTFVGEVGREPSGTAIVRGDVQVNEAIDANISGVDAEVVEGGSIHGTADVKTARGGTVAGVKAGRVGNTRRR